MLDACGEKRPEKLGLPRTCRIVWVKGTNFRNQFTTSSGFAASKYTEVAAASSSL